MPFQYSSNIVSETDVAMGCGHPSSATQHSYNLLLRSTKCSTVTKRSRPPGSCWLALLPALSYWDRHQHFAHSYGEKTATPIKHLIVIFGENISFDHYFGTYPNAMNPTGEPAFHARKDTPTINGLSGGLLTNNPNLLNPLNGAGATNPFRLDRSQAWTNDQNHAYGPEQAATHFGLMDLFPKAVGTAGTPPNAPPQVVTTKGLTMGYYDGNTVTALWNYAQHFAMSDNSYDTTFGPSTPGLMNLVSGQTNGVIQTLNGTGNETDGGNGTLTVVGDPDPIGDICSASTRNQVQMGGKNIGDLLNAAGVTWGSFMGGFDLTTKNANGTTGCLRSTGSTVVPEPPTTFRTMRSSSTGRQRRIPITRGPLQSRRSDTMVRRITSTTSTTSSRH